MFAGLGSRQRSYGCCEVATQYLWMLGCRLASVSSAELVDVFWSSHMNLDKPSSLSLLRDLRVLSLSIALVALLQWESLLRLNHPAELSGRIQRFPSGLMDELYNRTQWSLAEWLVAILQPPLSLYAPFGSSGTGGSALAIPRHSWHYNSFRVWVLSVSCLVNQTEGLTAYCRLLGSVDRWPMAMPTQWATGDHSDRRVLERVLCSSLLTPLPGPPKWAVRLRITYLQKKWLRCWNSPGEHWGLEAGWRMAGAGKQLYASPLLCTMVKE